jgi:hypothetical protein
MIEATGMIIGIPIGDLADRFGRELSRLFVLVC